MGLDAVGQADSLPRAVADDDTHPLNHLSQLLPYNLLAKWKGEQRASSGMLDQRRAFKADLSRLSGGLIHLIARTN